MSVFPITVEKVSLKHRGGTKEYNTVVISRADGVALTIFRWGKVKTWGQMDFHRGSKNVCVKLAADKIRDKERNGYQIEKSVELTANSVEELRDSALGSQYFFKLGEHAEYLMPPGADLTGVRKEEPVEWEVDPATGRHRRVEREAKKAEIEVEKPPSPYDSNPLYGAF